MSEKVESYVCLECGRLAGFKENNPQKCYFCGAQNWMSVDRFIETWPEPHFLMQDIQMKKQGQQTSFRPNTTS